MRTTRYRILVAVLSWLAACAADETMVPPRPPASPWCTWREDPGNPLIDTRIGQPILGDPTFLPPSETPDGQWHLIANALDGLYHFTGDDGRVWTRRQASMFGRLHMRAFLLREGADYRLLYEKFVDPLHSQIELRSSKDLFTWSEPVVLLEPSLPWEQRVQFTTGNPFLIRMDGTYRLYYSAGSVYLGDSLYFEPRNLGVAFADDLTGPYRKRGDPLLRPDDDLPFQNAGVGSLKILPEPVAGLWVAATNGIYRGEDGHSHSSIRLLTSRDGLAWKEACPAPILAPGAGWKRAYVYGFDLRRVGDELWLYFNARDGWFEGKERIGLATLAVPDAPPPH